MIGKCFFCDVLARSPIHVTEIEKGKAETYHMCKSCGEEFMSDTPKPKELDLNHIKTPEELLDFISDMRQPVKPDCKCGLSEKEFDKTGKFGCPHCYEHFHEKMDELVYPFHNGGREHVGKRPMRQIREQWESTPVEKMKLLKLRYAKAIEVEEYENAAELKKQIDDLNQRLSSASEGQ